MRLEQPVPGSASNANFSVLLSNNSEADFATLEPCFQRLALLSCVNGAVHLVGRRALPPYINQDNSGKWAITITAELMVNCSR